MDGLNTGQLRELKALSDVAELMLKYKAEVEQARKELEMFLLKHSGTLH